MEIIVCAESMIGVTIGYKIILGVDSGLIRYLQMHNGCGSFVLNLGTENNPSGISYMVDNLKYPLDETGTIFVAQKHLSSFLMQLRNVNWVYRDYLQLVDKMATSGEQIGIKKIVTPVSEGDELMTGMVRGFKNIISGGSDRQPSLLRTCMEANFPN